MSLLNVEGASLWYQKRGSGSPVLFISGLGGDHSLWSRTVEALSADYSCVVVDNRGTGGSRLDAGWATEEQYTLGRLADDIVGVIDALKISKVHIVGASMGGVVALLFATKYPARIRSISLHSTPPRVGALSKVRLETWLLLLERLDLEDFLLHLAPWIWSEESLSRNRERIDQFREIQRARSATISKAIYELQCRASIRQTSIDFTGIEVPALVTAGSDDLLVHESESRMIHEMIPGSSYHVFDRCGHAAFIEKEEEFRRVQSAFLARAR